MSFSSALIIMLLQVGPNPNAGGIPDASDDLRGRPPRVSNEIGPAQPTDPISIWLSDCLDQLDNDPSRAHTLAQIRRNDTEGAERIVANHCLGLAATELGLWDDARTAFLAARDETPADEPRARSRFGTMAGNAALGQGMWSDALSILQQAKRDARAASAGTLEAIAARDAARALVEIDQEESALQELEAATSLNPQNSEGWLLTATLLRRMERLTDAQSAIERAAEISPLDPQIGLEAGLIAVLDGREETARASWQSVIDTQPDSPQAKAARGYLGQLGPATPAP